MDMSVLLKKRLIFFVISTVFILIVTVASSYAFSNSDLNSDAVVINNSELQVLYESEQATDQWGMYPMSLQQGISETKASDIKVINKGNKEIKYVLKISNKYDSNNNLSFDKIYYSVNDCEPKILGNASDGIVFEDSIMRDQEQVVSVKVWLAAEYVTNDDQGKSANLKFEIIEK